MLGSVHIPDGADPGDSTALGDDAAVRGPVATFHLIRERSALRTLARLGGDRVRLARTDGLEFWRLLGTGAGDDTGPGADLRRSALFAVWRDEDALRAFERSMAPRWSRALEVWSVRLRPLGGHGTWRSYPVLDRLAGPSAPPAPPDADGPVAIITRADVRPGSWRAFRAAGPAVSDELRTADGLLAVVGIGEAPLGRLGTFSLWRDLAAARAFARNGPHHREVVARTRREHWYGEELFARFAPYASAGTWNGADPLASRSTGT